MQDNFFRKLYCEILIKERCVMSTKKIGLKCLPFIFSLILFIPMTLDAKLVISEIMYNPPASIDGNTLRDGDYEWIEFVNNSRDPLNIGGYKISAGNVDFPDSAVKFKISENIILPPMGYLIIARNAKIFDKNDKMLAYHYPPLPENCVLNGLNDFERMQKYVILHNKGCEIRVYDNSGNITDKVNYLPTQPWPIPYGTSIERIDLNIDGNNPLNWKAFRLENYYGSPGSPTGADSSLISVIVLNDEITVNEPEDILLKITNRSSSDISNVDIELPENITLAQNSNTQVNADKKNTTLAKLKAQIKTQGRKKKDRLNAVEFSPIIIKPFSTEIISISSVNAISAGENFQPKNKLKVKAAFVAENKTTEYNNAGLTVHMPGDGLGSVEIQPKVFIAGKYYKDPLKLIIVNTGKNIIDKIKIAFPQDWEWSGQQQSMRIISKHDSIQASINNNRIKQVHILLENCDLKTNAELQLELSNFRTHSIATNAKIPQTLFSVMTAEKNGILKNVVNIPLVQLTAEAVKAKHIVINEVLYYPEGDEQEKRHKNWIKLYNPTTAAVKINGWKLYDALPGTNKEGIWIIPERPEYSIKPEQEFIICADADFYIKRYSKKADIEANTDNYIKQGKKKIVVKEKDNIVPNLETIGDFVLSAKGDDVILVNEKGKIIDAVCWGRQATLKMPGSRNIVCEEGQTLKRIQSGCEANETEDDEYSEIIENSFEVIDKR